MATVSVAVTTFQFASTALTVTLKAPPAVWADGVPVLPLAVPGAAVSPGRRIWSFANAPGSIVVDGLVFAVIDPLLMSVDVNVAVPTVFAVTREALRAGDECGVRRQGGVGVGGRDADGVGRVDRVPVRVDGVHRDGEGGCPTSGWTGCRSCRRRVPGAAVSPGSRIWSFANAPGVDRGRGARVGGHRAVGDVRRGEGLRAGGLGRDREGLRAGDEGGVGGQCRVGVGGGDADGVGRGDGVPVGVDGVDGDVERGAGGLSRRGARLAGCGAGSGGLAREQDLELAEGSGGDRRRRARARRLAAVGLIRRRDGRRARGHEGDREGLRPGDEGGRGRRDGSCVARAQGDDSRSR